MSVAKTTRTVSQQGVKACKPAPVVVGRRAAAAGLLALGLLRPKQAAAEPAGDSSPSSGAQSISITRADKSVKAYLDARDEAMANKCPGGMFDCDGDRREYAKKQWQDFLESGGVPKRVRDGQKGGPRSF